MTKSKNKKGWLEKLLEADRKQQAQLNKETKSARPLPRRKSEQEVDDQLPKFSNTALILTAVALPFVAWLAGALGNPSGWASDDPFIFFILIGLLCIHYWYVSLPLAMVILVLLAMKQARIVTTFILFMSIVASLFIFSTTVNASESEFTG